MSMTARIRIGVLLGILATVIPPAAAPIDRVSGHLFGTSGMDSFGSYRDDVGAQDGVGRADDPVQGREGDAKTSALRASIAVILDHQETALLVGDLPGFLAAVDASDVALQIQLARRFHALRAMRVARWDESLAGPLTIGPEQTITASVLLRYCFAAQQCLPIEITVETRWVTSQGRIRLTAFGASSSGQIGPRPWETSTLEAAVGRRVIVAGTERWAGRLRSVLAAAERVAAVTDRYARWTDRPTRYIVYLAGPEEWGRWYGVEQAGWVAAYAIPLTEYHTEIVLNGFKVGDDDVRDVLRHEFAHVVTLMGVSKTSPNSWWLIEGIADYIQNVGLPISSYRALGDGRQYVRSSGWNGPVALGAPEAGATIAEANGRYAIAFLSVRRLAEWFGERQMLEFFRAVVRDGRGLEAASASALGLPWKQVSDELVRYVRRAL